MPDQIQNHLCSLCKALFPCFKKKLDGLIKNKPYQTHLGCYLSLPYLLRAYRLHVYATLSGATLTDLNLTAPSPRSLGVSLP